MTDANDRIAGSADNRIAELVRERAVLGKTMAKVDKSLDGTVKALQAASRAILMGNPWPNYAHESGGLMVPVKGKDPTNWPIVPPTDSIRQTLVLRDKLKKRMREIGMELGATMK